MIFPVNDACTLGPFWSLVRHLFTSYVAEVEKMQVLYWFPAFRDHLGCDPIVRVSYAYLRSLVVVCLFVHSSILLYLTSMHHAHYQYPLSMHNAPVEK